MNTVRIIAQSKIYNVVDEVNEDKAEGRLHEIKDFYEKLITRQGEEFVDEGLLVTTTLIKRNS
jgi:hypothetical protein